MTPRTQVEPNVLDQWYTYAHMKLSGWCSVGSVRDEPKMSKLDNLEEQVKMLMNMKTDLSPELEQRLLALEQHVRALDQRWTDAEHLNSKVVERPAKRQAVAQDDDDDDNF